MPSAAGDVLQSKGAGCCVRLVQWNAELLGSAKILPAPVLLGVRECLLSQDVVWKWLLAIPALLGVDVSVGPLRENTSSISLNW